MFTNKNNDKKLGEDLIREIGRKIRHARSANIFFSAGLGGGAILCGILGESHSHHLFAPLVLTLNIDVTFTELHLHCVKGKRTI